MLVYLDISIMTDKNSLNFIANLEISVVSGATKKKTRFYKGDFINTDGDYYEACDQFCKFLLNEYFYLIKKNSNKQVLCVINCDVDTLDVLKNSLWIDQLVGEFSLTKSSLSFKVEDRE